MSDKTLKELLPELGRPFALGAIKVKPLTKPASDGKSQAAFYIDARLVAERLNAVVGPENWSDDYRLLADGEKMPGLYYPIECALTVLGVTKRDVGQAVNTLDEKSWKSAYSDALKRAAVKFRIGASLYAIGRLRAEVKVVNGKAVGFTDQGRKQLYDAYARWLDSPLNTFGEALDHGDIGDDDTTTVEVPMDAEQKAEIKRLIVRLAELKGTTQKAVKEAVGVTDDLDHMAADALIEKMRGYENKLEVAA